jgi:hypothetical protein
MLTEGSLLLWVTMHISEIFHFVQDDTAHQGRSLGKHLVA